MAFNTLFLVSICTNNIWTLSWGSHIWLNYVGGSNSSLLSTRD